MPVEIDKLFYRCIECNTPLEDIAKEKIKTKVPEYVYQTQSTFKQCTNCRKIFWKGTHWDMVGGWLKGKGIKSE